jgi:hypothetical protein
MQLMAYLQDASLSVLTTRALNSSDTKVDAFPYVLMALGEILLLNCALVTARTLPSSIKITPLVKIFAVVTAHFLTSSEIILQVLVSPLVPLHTLEKLLESVLLNALAGCLAFLLEHESVPVSVLMDGGANLIKQSASIRQHVAFC